MNRDLLADLGIIVTLLVIGMGLGIVVGQRRAVAECALAKEAAWRLLPIAEQALGAHAQEIVDTEEVRERLEALTQEGS